MIGELVLDEQIAIDTRARRGVTPRATRHDHRDASRQAQDAEPTHNALPFETISQSVLVCSAGEALRRRALGQ
jgi:hypothetical protein